MPKHYQRYEVAGINGTRRVKENRIDEYTFSRAQSMKQQYGLHFTVPEIIETWEQYSETMAAGWLIDDKESIEDAFGVILREVSDD
jgi:hypothetical protein